MKITSLLNSTVLTLLLLSFQSAHAQAPSKNGEKRSCIVGIWPSQVEQVNGIMFNFWSKEVNYGNLDLKGLQLPTTNGIELNLNPVSIFVAPMILTYTLFDENARSILDDSISVESIAHFKKINGIQLALLNFEPTKMNGLEIHLAGSFSSIVNGISIGLVSNRRKKLNGLGIGVVGNFDKEVNGVQIGLLNKTKNLKGIQIGLWNTNEKRSLPFINWNF